MNLDRVIKILKWVLGLKARCSITFHFDGTGRITPELELKGKDDLIDRIIYE